MTANKSGGDVSYEWAGPDGRKVRPYKGRYWAYSKEKMAAMDTAGQIFYRTTGMPMLKHYLDEMPGVPLQTFWDDLKGVVSGSSERLGYPTQKPLALLERIIQASSNPNDVVLDAFCGCGTALEAAERLNRQWIGVDVSPTSCQVIAKRLRDNTKIKESEALWKIGRGFVVLDLPWSPEQLRKIPHFEFENWAVIKLNGLPNKAKVGDLGIDGRIFPVSAMPSDSAAKAGTFDFMDHWFPIQVKQKDKAGRQDIDSFYAAMMRAERTKGYFVSFDFTGDALQEISRLQKSGLFIKPLRVEDMLDDDKLAYVLA